MRSVPELIADVELARRDYVKLVAGLGNATGDFKPSPDEWSIAEITEHLYRAEHAGISLIWTAADGLRRGRPEWTGESENAGLAIEQIIERTWQPRETAPASARPEWGGPLDFWVASLRSCSLVLAGIERALDGLDIDGVIYPHVISGPLDARQRIEFLRFHIDRHRAQAERVMRAAGGAADLA